MLLVSEIYLRTFSLPDIQIIDAVVDTFTSLSDAGGETMYNERDTSVLHSGKRTPPGTHGPGRFFSHPSRVVGDKRVH